MNLSNINNLPQELLQSILLYLPVDEIIRHQSVCQLWEKRINDIETIEIIIKSQISKKIYTNDLNECLKTSSLTLKQIKGIIQDSFIVPGCFSNSRSKYNFRDLLRPLSNSKTCKLNFKSRYRMNDPISAPCALNYGCFAVGSNDCNLYVMKINNEKQLVVSSKHETKGEVYTPPCSLGKGYFAFMSYEGYIYAMQVNEKGELKKRSHCKIDLKGLSSLSPLGDGYFTFGSENGYMCLMRIDDEGNLKECSRSKISEHRIYTSLCDLGNGYFAVGSEDGRIYILMKNKKEKLETCSELKLPLEDVRPTRLWPLGDGYFAIETFACKSICLMRINENGKVENCSGIKMDYQFTSSSPCTLGGGYFVLGDIKDYIHLIRVNKEEKKLESCFKLKIASSAICSACALGGGYFTFASYDGPIYLMRMTKEKKLEECSKYDTRGKYFSSVCAIGDNYLAFVSSHGDEDYKGIYLMQMEEVEEKEEVN